MKKKLHKLIALFLLAQLHVAAQTAGFNYEAPITPVDSSGFYNIVLTPQLNAHLKTDYSDLRIVNDSGKWVPHLLRMPNTEIVNDPVMFERKILEKENTPLYTKIILEGKAEGISNIILTVKNTAAKRYCTLSGSDDRSSWFVINDSIEVSAYKVNENNNSSITLLFPPVNYKYFKVVINNNGKEPLNIISAGTEGINNLPGKWFRYPPVENPTATIFQKDSSKFSYIKIEQSASYHFEKIALKISGTKYFNRFAELYIPSSGTHSFYNPGRLIQTLALSNNSTLQFNVPISNTKTFYIIIQNDDNLPLKVEEVKTFVNYRIATAYLEKSKQYKLLLDNPIATAPNYDLSLKEITIKENIPLITVAEIISIQKPTPATPPKDNSKKLIWIVIGLAAIILGFFTYRLVTDMKKSKNESI